MQPTQSLYRVRCGCVNGICFLLFFFPLLFMPRFVSTPKSMQVLCCMLRRPSGHPKWQLSFLLRLRGAMPVHGDVDGVEWAAHWTCKPSTEAVNSTTIGDGIGKGFLITTKQLISWLFKRYCLLTNLSVWTGTKFYPGGKMTLEVELQL